jgi:hypothetical protein
MVNSLGADTDSSPDFRMSARQMLLVLESGLPVGKGVMTGNAIGFTAAAQTVTLRIIWHRILRAIWHKKPF